MSFAYPCDPRYGAWMGRWHARGPHYRQGFSRFAEFFSEPSPRAERGEVRYLVLDALAGASRHGYEVMQLIEQRSGGRYRPSPGVIYPSLQMLEELRHARAVEQDGRKVYEITDEGRRDLEEHRHLVDVFYERFDDAPWETHAEEIAELAKRFARMVKAFRRAARRGQVGPAKMRAVHQVFDEALERIEAIFSDERSER